MGLVFPFLGVVIYLGVAVYLVMLATRFVRAVEKIADKLDRSQ